MAKAQRKAQKRLDERIKDWEDPKNTAVRRHLHHKPGSMKKVH